MRLIKIHYMKLFYNYLAKLIFIYIYIFYLIFISVNINIYNLNYNLKNEFYSTKLCK